MAPDKKTSTAASGSKTCFIATPLGAVGSEIRKKAEGVIDSVLRPVLEEDFKYKVIVPHEIDQLGSITEQIIIHLLHDDLVIANLTGLNPNVMYELAVRHAAKKTVLCIAERDTVLPFDIAAERTVFYDDNMAGVNALRLELLSKIAKAEDDTSLDNPIYRAKASFKMQEVTKENTMENYIFQELSSIRRMLVSTSMEAKSQASFRPSDVEEYPFSARRILKLRVYSEEGDDLNEMSRKLRMKLVRALPLGVRSRLIDISVSEDNHSLNVVLGLYRTIDPDDIVHLIESYNLKVEVLEFR